MEKGFKGSTMSLRICTGCGENKPETAEYFYIRKDSKSGLRTNCKVCILSGCRGRYNRDKEKILDYQKEYYKNNCEKIKQYKNNYYDNNKDKQRNVNLKTKYGITNEGYSSLLEKQNYKCAICGVNNNGKHKYFCVDHNHDSGEVRGLLCKTCNLGLGYFLDNIGVLTKAIWYLENNDD